MMMLAQNMLLTWGISEKDVQWPLPVRSRRPRERTAMLTKEELIAAAAERYPDEHDPDKAPIAAGLQRHRREIYIEARTVSADELDAAAKGLWDSEPRIDLSGGFVSWDEIKKIRPDTAEKYLRRARNAFVEAGFYVEEEGASTNKISNTTPNSDDKEVRPS